MKNMTESKSSTTKNILCIKKKGFFGYPFVERAEGPDEDGIRWFTWYLEPNTNEYDQRMTVHMFAGDEIADIIIDEDIADDVADSALLYLSSRLRSVHLDVNRAVADTLFAITGNKHWLEV